jgi:hypothetical protein
MELEDYGTSRGPLDLIIFVESYSTQFPRNRITDNSELHGLALVNNGWGWPAGAETSLHVIDNIPLHCKS